MNKPQEEKITDYRIDYTPLFKILKERKMNRYNLSQLSGVTRNATDCIGKGLPISMKALLKICSALDCDVSDVMTIKDVNRTEQVFEAVS